MKKNVLTMVLMLMTSLGCVAQSGEHNGNTPPDKPDGGDKHDGGGSSVVYPDGAAYLLTDGSTVTKEDTTITCTQSDYNVVQVTSGNLTLNGCTLKKSGDTNTTDGDNTSFYGINSALFAGPEDSTKCKAVCKMTGGTITTEAKGSNACFATRGGVLEISGVTICTTKNVSRGLHATYGGHINATDVDITTNGETCSTIATDRGGGYVYVNGGTATANGKKSAVLYSTGTMEVTGLTGKSALGEIADVEGDNHVTMTDCDMTSGSSERGLMMLQSGSGDADGYNAAINVYNSRLTVTGESTPLCEVPTLNQGILTLSNASLRVASGVLLKVNYNTQWKTYGGTGCIVFATSTGTADNPWVYTGAVTADQYSYAAVKVGTGTLWYGNIDNSCEAKGDTVTVYGTWVLDSDSHADYVKIHEGGRIVLNGHTLTRTSLDISEGGTFDEATTGLTYTQTWVASGNALQKINGSKAQDDAFYDLSGRRLTGKPTHGVFIHNGQKIQL